VVSEEMILKANELGRSLTGIDVDHTGTAGMAALLDPEVASSIGRDEHVVVLFTGRRQG
jgi:threonine synthase